MHNNNKQCVIFDCEGTLVDSERLCCQVLLGLFQELGAVLTLDDVVESFDGGLVAELLNRLVEKTGVNADIDSLEIEYRHRTHELFDHQLRPMSGAVSLLEQLRRHHIDVCVASNSPKDKIESLLELCGLRSYFDDQIYSAFDANSWKPEPDLIHYCAMNMGYSLDQCVYIDDTYQGIEAGISAGVDTIHFKPAIKQVSPIEHLSLVKQPAQFSDVESDKVAAERIEAHDFLDSKVVAVMHKLSEVEQYLSI
ncbi:MULTISPECIES: HAD-IA family hydrolase [Vibrio]|uniref:HAD-IA family hydrolase n=2 Tax=Vibrio TaxID=662 RepID=A0A7X4LNH1_9VIBR|nr:MULTISPECIES: HAD-IA family hydrolase [Vibrio]MBF9003080.1 HAD-IA family hydrolase [Vibrio nitrifigilis]MZI95159.1 HAD-IA family hydrolase [Vibrio eleionomae]